MFELSLGIYLSKLIIIILDSQSSYPNIDIILVLKPPKNGNFSAEWLISKLLFLFLFNPNAATPIPT